MRFGFIYREYVESRGLFYDGNERNLKYCYDSEVAREWFKKNENDFVEIKMDRPPNKKVKIVFPLKEEWELDSSLDDWLAETKLSLRLEAVLVQFLSKYMFTWEGFVKKDNEKELAKEDIWVLANMKDIIFGMFRVSPVKVRSWFDKNTNKHKYTDWNFSQDITNVSYNAWGKSYKTNLFGLYVPQLKRAMLGAKYNGSPLQRWQNDAWFKMGRITFIVWSRELGKSILTTTFCWNLLPKELCTQEELERRFDIFYFGLSHESNNTVAGYIMSMMLSLIDDKTVIKWYKTAHKLVLFDWEQERTIFFKSQWDEGVGRGSRPHLVIIDEASRMDYEVYKTNIQTLTTQVICISTVNYDTKKNWFWEMYLQACVQQRDYEPIDELIHKIWTKHWMDKIKDREEILSKFEFSEDKIIKDNTFGKMKMDYFMARPLVGLKYTIDDDENKSEEQKKMIIEAAMKVWESYCLAELFSEVQDEHCLFNYEGLVEDFSPEEFDIAAVGFDEAENFDNAALVCIWVRDNKAYVVRSEILTWDLADRYAEVRRTLGWFRGKARKVLFSADITRWEAYYREITEKVEFIDYPVYYTKSSDAKYKAPNWLVGKKYLVDMTKNEFFNKFNLRISSKLNNDKGLVDELSEFREASNGKMQARKGKDDQVNAMMVALFAIYQYQLKDIYTNIDKRWMLDKEERYQRLIDAQDEREEEERRDKIMNHIYAHFW